jgi:DNA repair protein RadD
MELRPYQTRAITQLYDWFRANDGNPCLVLPTGAGKSHIVAALCKDAVQNYPSTRILMLTHQKELIQQNYEKLRQHWRNAPVGIYSASVGKNARLMPSRSPGYSQFAPRHNSLVTLICASLTSAT